jgi:hypothetical protein
MHQYLIDRQSVQPGSKCTLSSEAANLAKQLDKDFLREVFCFCCIGGHSQAEGIDSAVMAFVEHFEGRHVAGGGTLRQRVVRLLRLRFGRLFAFGALKEWECGSVCGHHVFGMLQAPCRRKSCKLSSKSSADVSLRKPFDQKGLQPTESV